MRTREEVLSIIEKAGIVPVVVLDDAKDASSVANALINGGINVAEVTFRTEAAAESIKIIKNEYPDMLVGAGTILNVEQVDAAIYAGAEFIVTPGCNTKVIGKCIEKGIPIVPGCANPTNVETALEYGIKVVKFFPAEQAGGIEYIKAISAPYTDVRFMPTGGINASNVGNYLSNDRIIACGGSWMVKKSLINEGLFDEITNLCKEAVEIVSKYRK